MPGKYPTDKALREDLIAFRTEQQLTNGQLAERLGIKGVTNTFISKYLNDNLDREIEGFDATCRDILKSLKERIAFGSEIFESSMTTRIASCLNLIRKTGDIALITSPAGHGKTSARNAYAAANPSTVVCNLTATTREAKRVEALVFDQVDHRDWKGNSGRWKYLVDRFKGTSRLLIVDNAQRLDATGRQWLFDFHDEADCPIALIANPELLDRIRSNDQQFSRIGIHAKYELLPKELASLAKKVAVQFSDAGTAELIEDLCAFVAGHEGRLRAVRKTVVLMQELRKASAELNSDPRKAFRAAHSRLVRDYQLPADS